MSSLLAVRRLGLAIRNAAGRIRSRLPLRFTVIRFALFVFLLFLVFFGSRQLQWFAGSVEGLVVDPLGMRTPIAGAIVENGKRYSTVVDRLGRFKFDSLRPGPHDLTVWGVGFNAEERSIEIKARRTAKLDTITLKFATPRKAEHLRAWKDKSGRDRTPDALEQILLKHRDWLNSGAPVHEQYDPDEEDVHKPKLEKSPGTDRSKAQETVEPQRAELQGAILEAADLADIALARADLSGAQLTNARLFDANLQDTTLQVAKLSGAYLTWADLRGARLNWAKLDGAHLEGADLTEANLEGADLSWATLNKGISTGGTPIAGANLSGADMKGAILSNASWEGANLSGAFFEPAALPDIRKFARADNLEDVTYDDNPQPLLQLRKQFQDGGLREPERKITYALKRTEAEKLWLGCAPWAERKLAPGDWENEGKSPWRDGRYGEMLGNCADYAFNRVFFDFTCRYGMQPWRPPLLILLGGIVLSLVYPFFMARPGPSGLYLVARRIQRGKDYRHRIRIVPHRVWTIEIGKRKVYIPLEQRLYRAALCFSFLTAFTIGFREITIGQWLRLLTKRVYDIDSTGWARVVAGLQSLISVYLLALWLLTYFGRPFE